ncbi:acyl-CoA thioesterase, partial [Lysinibacillus fusiformis]|uniref:acyl-CoA thioesterase n=1 Tax=Lysinibacillus fusiformis TaxID=28031 RepID=UPI0023ED60AE
VTASIVKKDFLSAAHIGDILEIESIVSSTGRSSMEVYVRVVSRNIETGEENLTTESFVTMVAVNEEGKP